jgi:hypothetical protein
MAIYAIVFLGSTPIGGPLIGWISQHASPRVGMATGALASLLAGTVAMASRAPRVRARFRAAAAATTVQR